MRNLDSSRRVEYCRSQENTLSPKARKEPEPVGKSAKGKPAIRVATSRAMRPKSKGSSRKVSKTSVDWGTVRELALKLPGTEESTSYGTPAIKVRGKLFVRFHQSGESIVISMDFEEREALMNIKPDRFYITDHYSCWPWVLVRLSTTGSDEIAKILEGAWRRIAPPKLVASYNAEQSRQD